MITLILWNSVCIMSVCCRWTLPAVHPYHAKYFQIMHVGLVCGIHILYIFYVHKWNRSPWNVINFLHLFPFQPKKWQQIMAHRLLSTKQHIFWLTATNCIWMQFEGRTRKRDKRLAWVKQNTCTFDSVFDIITGTTLQWNWTGNEDRDSNCVCVDNFTIKLIVESEAHRFWLVQICSYYSIWFCNMPPLNGPTKNDTGQYEDYRLDVCNKCKFCKSTYAVEPISGTSTFWWHRSRDWFQRVQCVWEISWQTLQRIQFECTNYEIENIF